MEATNIIEETADIMEVTNQPVFSGKSFLAGSIFGVAAGIAGYIGVKKLTGKKATEENADDELEAKVEED